MTLKIPEHQLHHPKVYLKKQQSWIDTCYRNNKVPLSAHTLVMTLIHYCYRGLREINVTCRWQTVINTAFVYTACKVRVSPPPTNSGVSVSVRTVRWQTHPELSRTWLIYIRVFMCLSDCIYWACPLPSCRHRHRLYPRQGGWAEATLWRWTRLSWWDAVLPQCKHFPALYYHYHGWCYCYNSHFGKRLSCSDRKAENG